MVAFQAVGNCLLKFRLYFLLIIKSIPTLSIEARYFPARTVEGSSSPAPRSRADGPWEPYQFYSASCQKTYSRPEGQYLHPGEDERVAFCTSEFSDISPLSGGNVAFSTLEGRPSAYNFEESPGLQGAGAFSKDMECGRKDVTAGSWVPLTPMEGPRTLEGKADPAMAESDHQSRGILQQGPWVPSSRSSWRALGEQEGPAGLSHAGARRRPARSSFSEWVTSTELLISLNRLNTFGDDIFKDPRVLQSYYYAVSDFSVGGR
ncbi:hypothetical protein P7K49_001867 [Saguinus oedipus]|uniref:Laminin N-terminal domain-containing protein n=1 Tax=Saguinus oedipus TaxID=9490 RepID=A0ABQ9WFQ8_SAGOE|nr:hypothetical protein P7K49_001867 [Saguinus oedipus]